MLELFIASTEIADALEVTELSVYRARKIRSLRREDAQNQSKAAGVLLAYALKRCFGVDESRVCYAETDRGKPYIPGYPNIHFSITHTEGLCAVAVSDMPIGVDAEFCDGLNGKRSSAVAERFFAESEKKAFGLTDTRVFDREQTRGFYRLWTAKESVAKCSGEGLAEARCKTEIPFFEGKGRCGDYYLSAFELERHTVTVCTHRGDDVKPEIITAKTAKNALS